MRHLGVRDLQEQRGHPAGGAARAEAHHPGRARGLRVRPQLEQPPDPAGQGRVRPQVPQVAVGYRAHGGRLREDPGGGGARREDLPQAAAGRGEQAHQHLQVLVRAARLAAGVPGRVHHRGAQ